MKIRVRTYRDLYASAEDLPAFFEIKRKSHGLVHKTRAKVPYRLANQLLWSDVGYDFDAGGLDEMACENLKKFTCERAQIGAFPALAVHYTREAFETEMADRVRISLDRNLHYGLLSAPSSGERIVWRPVHCNWVILEIKFTNTYPFWIADLVRTGEISRRGVCKYVMCHEASQEPAVAAIA